MIKSPDHLPIQELIKSPEKELEDLKKQNKPVKNEKEIRDLEDQLTVMRELLVIRK